MSDIFQAISSTPNSGRLHLFLGHPLSDGGDKTVVEPGNTTSPGIWTCGISLWWGAEQGFVTPDTMEQEQIGWTFGGEDGLPPEVTATYAAHGRQVTHLLATLGTEGSEGVDFHQVVATKGPETDVYIVVRSEGPAGKTLKRLAWEGDSELVANTGTRLAPDKRPDETIIRIMEDEPVAVLRYRIPVGTPFELGFKVLHRFHDHPMGSELPVSRYWTHTIPDGFTQAKKEWEAALPARIVAPDKRLVQTWERCCAHILNAMELGNPRIGAVHYPLFWIRDGVLVLRALDLMGRHDLARIGADALAPMIYGGGFGAEADAPGEGIWAMFQHYGMTGDDDWLCSVFPAIRKRVEEIFRMLHTDKILHGLSENRACSYMDSPAATLICFPAKNGCIDGRMDFHHPNFYINHWAWRGLCDASSAATLLGNQDLAKLWQKEADALAEAIRCHLLPAFGSNERDGTVSPHPCGTTVALESFAPQYMSDFMKRRLKNGKRVVEPLWSYFEAAQIHNAMLCGHVDEAWTCLDSMLSDGIHDVSVYCEGPAGDPDHNLKFGNGAHRRGWLSPERSVAGNMPHNWTNAEMVALLRDLLVCEREDGLLLGLGVPESWLLEGAQFGVSGMPTNKGPVSYLAEVRNGKPVLIQYSGPQNHRLCIREG